MIKKNEILFDYSKLNIAPQKEEKIGIVLRNAVNQNTLFSFDKNIVTNVLEFRKNVKFYLIVRLKKC